MACTLVLIASLFQTAKREKYYFITCSKHDLYIKLYSNYNHFQI